MTELNAATVEAIADLAVRAELGEQLEPGSVYAFMHPHATGPTIVSLQGDEYLKMPERKRGTVTVTDVASFAQYYAKHSSLLSEVFADLDAATVTAVLDAHEKNEARWQQHRLTLTLAPTPEWATWTGSDRRMMTQSAFAEFIEDAIADIAADGPCTGSDLLEMAQQFQAHTKVEFKQGTRLASGESQFVYVESTEAKAGERGTITVPGAFELGLRVFDDCEPYRVKARFRYRLTGGVLAMGYHLDDPARKHRDAVTQVVTKAEKACKVTVMRGRPG
jgi:uncharacterized protein YfdQ (DUF2303 family)